jgi:hypothetical protein
VAQLIGMTLAVAVTHGFGWKEHPHDPSACGLKAEIAENTVRECLGRKRAATGGSLAKLSHLNLVTPATQNEQLG